MRRIPISNLEQADAIVGTELIPVVQDGSTKRATLDFLVSGSISAAQAAAAAAAASQAAAADSGLAAGISEAAAAGSEAQALAYRDAAENHKNNALIAQLAAENARDDAIAVSDAPLWVSGTTYAIGDAVLSPITFRTYRDTVGGASTTDPSSDLSRWKVIEFDKLTGAENTLAIAPVAVWKGVLPYMPTEDIPTSVLVVAEASQVTVHSLDTGSPVSWKVGDLTGLTITDVEVAGTTLWIGTTTGLVERDLTGSLDASAVDYSTSTTPALVNNTVNAIATYTAPNATLNDAGRPIETVAVFTDGGVSVINGPAGVGTVVNITRSGNPAIAGKFSDEGGLWITFRDPGDIVYYQAELPLVDEAVNETVRINNDSWLATNSIGGAGDIGNFLDVVPGGAVISSDARGLVWFYPNGSKFNEGSSFARFQDTDYATPPMFGGCKFAGLCEADDTDLVGGTTPDRSVSGNDLTVNGTVVVDAELWYGPYSAANNFELAYTADFDFGTGAFVIPFALKMDANTATEVVIERDSLTSAQRITIDVTAAGFLRFTVDDGTTARSATGTVAIDDNQPRLCSAVYDGAGGVFLYVDDALYASATGAALLTMDNASAILKVGADVNNGSPLASGKIKLLTASEGLPSAEQIYLSHRASYGRVKHGGNPFLPETALDIDLDEATGLTWMIGATKVWAMDGDGILADSTLANKADAAHDRITVFDGEVSTWEDAA